MKLFKALKVITSWWKFHHQHGQLQIKLEYYVAQHRKNKPGCWMVGRITHN